MSCWPLLVKKRGSTQTGTQVLRWYNCVCVLKKKDEEKKMEVEHPNNCEWNDSQCRWRNRSVAQDHETNSLERKRADFEGRRRRCDTFARCEEKKKEWAKKWQCDTKVQDLQSTRRGETRS